MRHFLSANDISHEELLRLFKRAEELEHYLGLSQSDIVCSSLLAPCTKLMGTLFLEPSTRTRLSFEVAMKRLGGQVVSVADGKSTSCEKGESLEDTIRTMSNYVDLLVVRANAAHGTWGKHFGCPIINGGDGSNEHPTQALADAYTIFKAFGTLEDLKVAFVGDLFHGRTAHSLLRLLVREHGNKFYLLSANPEQELPHTYYYQTTQKWTVTAAEMMDMLPHIDVLYTTRVQQERGSDRDHPFKLSKEIVEMMHPEGLIMHPMPRLNEIPKSIDNDHRAVYFDQAKNGVPIRMALVKWLFERQ